MPLLSRRSKLLPMQSLRIALPKAHALLWLGGVLATPLLAAQSSPAPAVDIVFPNYDYGIRVHSFRQVDFQNLKLVIFGGGGKPYQVPLSHGAYEKIESSGIGGTSVSLGKVRYIDGPHGASRYALLDIGETDWGGSSTNTGIIQILHLEDDHLTIVQQITYDLQAPGTGAKFNSKTHVLVMTGRSDDDSPHCCAQSVDIVTFMWTGTSFKMVKSHKRPVPSDSR